MPKKKKEPQPSDLANTLAEHLTNAEISIRYGYTQAIQEVNAIKRLLSKETDK